ASALLRFVRPCVRTRPFGEQSSDWRDDGLVAALELAVAGCDPRAETAYHEGVFCAAFVIVVEIILAFRLTVTARSVNSVYLNPLACGRRSVFRRLSFLLTCAPLRVLHRNVVVLIAAIEGLSLILDGFRLCRIGDQRFRADKVVLNPLLWTSVNVARRLR